MNLILLVLVISVAAYVWTCLLTQPGDIFDFIQPALFDRDGCNATPAWQLILQKIFFQCERCFAGQLALWTYPIIMWSEYAVRDHFLVVLFSIFCTHIIATILPHD